MKMDDLIHPEPFFRIFLLFSHGRAEIFLFVRIISSIWALFFCAPLDRIDILVEQRMKPTSNSIILISYQFIQRQTANEVQSGAIIYVFS